MSSPKTVVEWSKRRVFRREMLTCGETNANSILERETSDWGLMEVACSCFKHVVYVPSQEVCGAIGALFLTVPRDWLSLQQLIASWRI